MEGRPTTSPHDTAVPHDVSMAPHHAEQGLSKRPMRRMHLSLHSNSPLVSCTASDPQTTMDVSPMSITPAGTPGEAPSDSALSITSADSKTQLRRSGDPSGSGSGEGHGHGRSYFRRTSLAIAAARRFTLYEAVAATPGSPISPINSRVHFGDTLPSPVNARPQPQPQQIAAPTPTSTSPTSRFGVSFGTSFFNRSSGVPVRYASPLQESEEERQGQGQGQGQDEEAAIGATGETAYGAERAHTAATATPTRRKPTRGATSSSFRPPGTPMTPRRRRSSVVQARYRWLSGGSNTGDEPGVDVRSERDQEAYGHLKGKTHITVRIRIRKGQADLLGRGLLVRPRCRGHECARRL